MDRESVKRIETELGVVLPESYAVFLTSERSPAVDSTTAADEASVIIEWTKNYRRGFGNAPAWPKRFVYVGDESDACPYALDCVSGVVVWTDHGYVENPPLARFDSINDFLEHFEAEHAKESKSKLLRFLGL